MRAPQGDGRDWRTGLSSLQASDVHKSHFLHYIRCMTHPYPPTLGLVLAGGLARRMGGGDKARIELGGVTILDRVLATLSAQTTGIIVNANGDPARFADTGLTVVPDNIEGHPGPLAGILAGR